MTHAGRQVLLPILALCLFAGCGTKQDLVNDDLSAALAAIDPQVIEEHMRYLAGDALAGRGTGTRGYLVATEYVARRFKELGLEPAGEDGGFLQTVPLIRTDLDPERSSLTLIRGDDRRRLELERDYVMRGDFLREGVELTAPAVFAGFGVSAAEFDHDDYAGLDVQGKIVLVFRGAPADFPHNERAYYASRWVKERSAVNHGAVGVITMLTPADQERSPWERTVRHSRMGSMRWTDGAALPHDTFAELFVDARLSPSGMQAVFEGAPRTLEEVVEAAEASLAQGFDLPLEIHLRTTSVHQNLSSPNVLAQLPGADPALARQFLVLSAHLDHVGTEDREEGDAIYNGAYDNASGVAVMLEIARALAELPEAPARSVILAAVTGEEKGLLGSDFFVHHPTVQLGSIVANINLDMVMMQHPLHDVVAFGVEHSTLAQPVERAVSHLGLSLSPDPMPEEVVFVRSDQYSFVRKAVPSVFVVSGFESGSEELDGEAEFRRWMRTVYHTPGDDMLQDIDFDAGARFARVNFLITWLVANDPERPAWNPGDFFGEKFKYQRRK